MYSLIAVREEKYGHYEEEQSENHGLNLYSVFESQNKKVGKSAMFAVIVERN